MKKIILPLCFIFILIPIFSQNPDLDELLPKIAAEKNDSIRFYLAFSGLTISETNPVLDMLNAERILVEAQKNNDPVSEVLALGCLGYDYRAFGNTAKSLEYDLKTDAIAEQTKDNRLIAIAKLGLSTNYLDLAEYSKAISINLAGLEAASKVEVNLITIMLNHTLGEIYLAVNKIDSALIYTQKAYELSMQTGMMAYVGAIYGQLGTIQAKMHNSELAVSYFNLALEEANKIKSPKYISLSYYSIADNYYRENQIDSATVYAKKAIGAVENTAFSTMRTGPSKLLLDIYRHTNIDSAFKYSEMHRIANDSLFNIKTIQEAQLMIFEADAQNQEAKVAEMKTEEHRKQNIQYALLALSIICFIILFLLLSRSFITNTKLIEFLGVMALLIVFEFVNLLFHPFLAQLTHDSPSLMLVALVCLAALLVPLHHKLEKWTTNKLIEKNKAIRLANAKKTIQQLEG